MSEVVTHACIKYLDDQLNYYYESIQSIYYKKNDEAHISPKDLNDFEKTHKYYVLWELQGKDRVTPVFCKKDNNSLFYPGYIVCLGESEADARIRATNKSKRLILPKVLTSSDENEKLCDENKKLKPQSGKIIKNIVQKVNSQRTMDKYKQSMLMKNRQVLSLDNRSIKDNLKDIENDSGVENDASKMQTTQRELKVILRDFLKEDREMKYQRDKTKDETRRKLEHCMSLPICSTPKKRIERFSNSYNEHIYRNLSPKSLRLSYPPSRQRTYQAGFSRSQQVQDSQHISSVVTYKSLVSQISQLSPILAGSQVNESETLPKSNNQTPRVSDSQIPLGSEIGWSLEDSHETPERARSRTPLSTRNASGLAVVPRQDSLLKTISDSLPVNPQGSRRRISSNSPLGSVRGSRSLPRSLDTVKTPERSRSRTSLLESSGSRSSDTVKTPERSRSRTPLLDSPEVSPTRSLSRSSGDFSESTRQDQSTPKPSATNRQIRRPGPRSRTQQKPTTEISGRRLGPRSQTQQKPTTEISGRRPGPRSRTQQNATTEISGRRPGPRSRTQQNATTAIPSSQQELHEPQDPQDDNQDLEVSAASEESDFSAVPMLEQYKPKLNKKYRKLGYDLDSVIPERHERYEIVRNKVYLAESVRVGQKSWRIMKVRRRKGCLRDLGTVLWTKKILAQRCLDTSKLKQKTFGSVPIQLFSPRKLNLYLSLYSDFLETSNIYKDLAQESKDIFIKNSTSSLSFHCRDERKHQTPPNA